MPVSATMTQWRSNLVNCQNGIALPVLDPKLKGYEITELYQQEIEKEKHLKVATFPNEAKKVKE
eukprot:40378-Ditylum_brightwellii.AAC.1